MKYFKSSVVSAIVHIAIICVIVFYSTIIGCRTKKKPIELVDFTIAVEPMAAEPEPPAPAEPPKIKEEPPPQKDDVPLMEKKVEPKPKPNPPEKKPDPPKKDPPKKDPPKKTPAPIVKGNRVTKPPVPVKVQPKEKQTLSDEEIKKWLNGRTNVKVGERTSLPQNELSLYYSLIKNALYDAWRQPPQTSAGSRPAVVEFSLGAGGRVSNPRLEQSSGSAEHDRTALEAVKSTTYIQGLSAEFLRQNKTIMIEFMVQ